MNKRLISLMATALALLSVSGQVEFTGYGNYPPIEITLSKNHTSLNKIYVVYDIEGVSMTFNSATGEPAKWENYNYVNGTRIDEPVPGVRWNGMATTLDKIIPNKGYTITEGTTPFYCWVVNYADYALELNDMFFNNEEPCNLLTFNIDGHGDAIPYYEINGHRQVLDRKIELIYNTLEWDTVTTCWKQVEVIDTFPAIDQGVEIAPPLCNTYFKLKGDWFLKQWNIEQKEIDCSNQFVTQAVGAKTTAILQDVRTNGNERDANSDQLSGSAPRRIIFTGYATEGVVYRVWEMATDPEFENIILQYNQDEVDYTFDEWGTYYMRYVVDNAEGTCRKYGEDVVTGEQYYTIMVSESQLECPNVFSPGSTKDVNDVWKVSYKSLVEFHCWIFNRWGTLVCEFTDPSEGWDGKYNGKLVDTGVYYYVVTAVGSDGVKYKRRGDITILRYKKGADGTSGGAMDGTGGY